MRVYQALLAVWLSVFACAPAARGAGGRQAIPIPERNDAGTGPAIPAGVTLEDGLTAEEAVTVALWNNPDFRAQLADLGFARADLLEAGLLRNPVLALLFPVGPKQLEATLRLPVEVLWERPRRVAAARVSVDRVAASLEQHGLNLVAETKLAMIEWGLSTDRAALLEETAASLDRIRDIARARLRAGDISELEARFAEIDAARAREEVERARLDVGLRASALRARLGLALNPAPVSLARTPSSVNACSDRSDLVDAALAARPDVRAAEIGVEGAAARMGWERSRVFATTAVLDLNGPKNGAPTELGPGLDLGLPIFDRNQAGKARASSELERTAWTYIAVRQRVATEVTDAAARLSQADTSRATWRTTVVDPLAAQESAAQRAFEAGDTSYLFVLEMTRRLTEARLRAREIEADVARATTALERALGRACTPATQGDSRGF